jgi:hypothetical protein
MSKWEIENLIQSVKGLLPHFGNRVCSSPRDVRSSACVLEPRPICAQALLSSSLSIGALEHRCARAQMLCARPQAFKMLPKCAFIPIFNGILASDK